MRTTQNVIVSLLTLSLLAGSAVAVAAQDGDTEPLSTSFTGKFTSQSDPLREGSGGVIDGIDHIEGLAARGSMISSDPRLTGTFIYTANWLIDTTAGTNTEHMANILKAGTYELTTDEGSWFGEITGFGNIDLGVNYDVIVFEGRGAYEGLTAVVHVDWQNWLGEYVGTIFPAAMPEVPEPYVDG